MIKAWTKKILSDAGVQVSLKKNLWYQDPWLVKQRLLAGKHAPVILDVGASEGTTVEKYAVLFPDAQLHAFEPQPAPFSRLQAMAAKNSRLVVNNVALSDRQGSANFFVTEGVDASSLLRAAHTGSFVDEQTKLAETLEVRVQTLDAYASEKKITRIDLLKMDVQGNELNVLRGATQLLSSKQIDLVYAELLFTHAYEGQGNYEELVAFLRGYNFSTVGFYDIVWNANEGGEMLWCDAIFKRAS